MAKIWANRLIAGTKTWSEVPPERRGAVLAELASRVYIEEISAEQYTQITGEVLA